MKIQNTVPYFKGRQFDYLYRRVKVSCMEDIKYANPWKTLTNDKVYESPWISVTRHDVINPSGNAGVYSVVHFKNIAVGIIPLDEDNNTWIVGQYRYPLDQYSWEIVEGGCPVGTDPLESGKRELLEETGIVAKHWTKIQELHLSNSATDEFGVLYIARGLEFHAPEPEDSEQLEVRKIPFTELYEMVMDGRITDSLSVIAVLKAKMLMDKGEL
jgi:ADP-ribose pyrophosphatase